MQDLVIIPTYDRPELLWLCLEYLAASPESRDVEVRVYVDNHAGFSPPKADIEAVLDKFTHLSLHVCYRPPHRFPGNSFNVLMAYKEAHATAARHVFLVEDDILIRPEFFTWHRQQHERKTIACSIGVLKERQHGPYASLGVCFRREVLRVILPHCNAVYFQNLRAYCRQRFAPAPWDCEQDGLFCRVLIGHEVVWATTPVAQHVGWYGYHRKKSVRPTGTLDERYRQVKWTLQNPAVLKAMSRDFGDVAPLEQVVQSSAKGR